MVQLDMVLFETVMEGKKSDVNQSEAGQEEQNKTK